MHITSRDNSLLRQARAVRDGKIDELIYVEGLRLCEEVLRSQLEIEAVIVSEELLRKERVAPVIKELSQASKRFASVSEKLLESVSYTKTPQGIIVLAQRPEASETRLAAQLDANPLLVVLHQINNPVNVGAILRTSEAAGATGVIATRNTSDPFSPKSLRGAMGSAFRLSMWSGPSYTEMIEWCHQRGIATICADVDATTSYTEIDSRSFSLTDAVRFETLDNSAIACAARSFRNNSSETITASIVRFERCASSHNRSPST